MRTTYRCVLLQVSLLTRDVQVTWLPWPYLACYVTCKRQVCHVFTCCYITTETCDSTVVGRLSMFATCGRFPWKALTSVLNCQNTHKHPCLGGIRTHDLSVGAGEDSSCLRPRGHCDRLRSLSWTSSFTDSPFIRPYKNSMEVCDVMHTGIYQYLGGTYSIFGVEQWVSLFFRNARSISQDAQ
jgi:hypothetical protein